MLVVLVADHLKCKSNCCLSLHQASLVSGPTLAIILTYVEDFFRFSPKRKRKKRLFFFKDAHFLKFVTKYKCLW